MFGYGKMMKRLFTITSIGILSWIPGLVAVLVYQASYENSYNRPTVLYVGLFWWSVWLSSIWFGFWVCILVATHLPLLLRSKIGVFSVAFKTPLDFAVALKGYVAFFLWSLLVWVIFLSTVWSQFPGHDNVSSSLVNPLAAAANASSNSSSSSTSVLADLAAASALLSATGTQYASNYTTDEACMIAFSRFFFGLFVCSAILLAEKVSIHAIALSFHKVTYSDRIEKLKYHISVLASLLSQTNDGTREAYLQQQAQKVQSHLSSSIIMRAKKYKSSAAAKNSSTSQAIHSSNVLASSLNSVYTPFSLDSIVEDCLETTVGSLRLAERLFDAYSTPLEPNSSGNSTRVVKENSFALRFPTKEAAHAAFLCFDTESNKSITREEMEMALLEMHRDTMCLFASLHDIDSAVLKLDNFFMSFYTAVGCIVIAALLSSKVSTLLASLATLSLGLSWLIGSTAQESLASIVWVFCKHPIDVGDAIEVPALLLSTTDGTSNNTFFVEEIQLLSTILKTTTGKYISISNYQLSQRPIINVRRSGPIQEKLTIEVKYTTTMKQLNVLRESMVKWLQERGRDFLPGLDIEMNSLGDQSKMILILDIRYKSNWQNDHLRTRRRNAWIGALKGLMRKLKIYGPQGDPDKWPDVQRVAMVDNDNVHQQEDAVEDAPLDSNTLIDEHWEYSHGQYVEASLDEGLAGQVHPISLAAAERSRLNEAMPSAAPRHGSATTHLDPFNVRGRIGEDQRMGDLELGPEIRH
jgi:hypothetical protein